MAAGPSPILVAIREDLARLETAAAGVGAMDETVLAELYPAAQDALGELAEALERLARMSG